MDVAEWLRGHFHGIGNQIEESVLAVAALSPIQARPNRLPHVGLSDQIEDYIDDPQYQKGLTYALSTLYYSMSSAVTGGTKSEKRGNRQISIGGYALTTRDRDAFRKRGDQLRRDLGCYVEESRSASAVLFDGRFLSYNKKSPSRHE